MAYRRVKMTVTTDASGNAVVLSPQVAGLLHQIEYVKDGTNPYSNGVDFTITDNATGKSLWTENDVNASAIRAPRQPVHTQAGAAMLYASGGAPVPDRLALAQTQIKVSIAQGGNAKTGVFHVLIG